MKFYKCLFQHSENTKYKIVFDMIYFPFLFRTRMYDTLGGCCNSFLVFVSDSSKFRLAENLV